MIIRVFLILLTTTVYANNKIIDLGQLENINGEMRRPLIEYYDNAALRDNALKNLAVENLRTSENLLMSADKSQIGQTKIQEKKLSIAHQLQSFEKKMTENK